MADAFPAMAVTAITGTAGPIWSERADAKKAADAAQDRHVEVRAQEHLGDGRVDLAGERLDGDVGEREQEAGGCAEHDARVLAAACRSGS